MADRTDSRITNAPVGATLMRPVPPAWLPSLADFAPRWGAVREEAGTAVREVNDDVAAGQYGRALGAMLRGTARVGATQALSLADPVVQAGGAVLGGVGNFVRGIVGAPAREAQAPPAPAAAPATQAPAAGQVPHPTEDPRLLFNPPRVDPNERGPFGLTRREADILSDMPRMYGGQAFNQAISRTSPRAPSGADMARMHALNLVNTNYAALEGERQAGRITPAEFAAQRANLLRDYIAISGGNPANGVTANMLAEALREQ